MVIANLAASPFVGGPESQMLGVGLHLGSGYRSFFLSFAEGGRAMPLLGRARECGFEAVPLTHNWPRIVRCVDEVARHLRRLRAAVLCCHGYKPDLIGLLAARRVGIPVIAVAHGWTGATLKVRMNEALDRRVLRWMDRVICVSEAQAVKVRAAGVSPKKVVTIRNAVDPDPFSRPDPTYRDYLNNYFAQVPRHIVCAAGRFSPEKGFEQLIEAAAILIHRGVDVGFVLFGDGPLRQELAGKIEANNLPGRFILAGFREDVHKFLPHAHVFALSSYTEGLPVVILEAMASGVPVVATAVGGVAEAVEGGVSGYLVPAGSPTALADRITDVLENESRRQEMGLRGRERILREFTCERQAREYQLVLEKVVQKPFIVHEQTLPLPRNL